MVASEEPPSSANTKRRVDIFVKYFEPPNYSIRILCFVEAKRPNADLTLVDEVEHQAFDACAAYLWTNKLQHIYAMTTIGTRARLWIYRPDSDYLEPLFGSQDLSDRSAYVEAHSSDAYKLTAGFHHMKTCHQPAKLQLASLALLLHFQVMRRVQRLRPHPPHWGRQRHSHGYGMKNVNDTATSITLLSNGSGRKSDECI